MTEIAVTEFRNSVTNFDDGVDGAHYRHLSAMMRSLGIINGAALTDHAAPISLGAIPPTA